jgi:flagellar protein FlaG
MHVMSEEEINPAGQCSAVNSSTDSATSYQTSSDGARQSAGTPAAAQATAGGDATVAAQPAKQPSSDEINKAVSAANANLAGSSRMLEYRIDAATGLSIAMIRDSQTGVVVQQIPGIDIIALAKMLQDWSPGKHMLLDLIA